jgi:hypothetical protein
MRSVAMVTDQVSWRIRYVFVAPTSGALVDR